MPRLTCLGRRDRLNALGKATAWHGWIRVQTEETPLWMECLGVRDPHSLHGKCKHSGYLDTNLFLLVERAVTHSDGFPC